MNDTESTSAIFMVYNNKLALILRDDIPTIAAPGKWALPGGHIQENETAEEGLSRELLEEVGFAPGKVVYLGKYYEANNIPKFQYFSRLTDSERENIKLTGEGQKLEFLNFEELMKLKLSGMLVNDFNVFTENGLREMLDGELPVDRETFGLI